MNWIKAKELLSEKIYKDLDLDPENTYKIITESNAKGFRFKVGAKKDEEISYQELEMIFEKSKENAGNYNNSVVKVLYPRKLQNTPCLVQAVGKMFVIAGVMTKETTRNYQIIK